MHYPRPPRRPQAYRVRFVGRRHSTRAHRVSTWYFCVAALALVATIVALDTSQRAVAAPEHLEPPAQATAVDGAQAHAWGPQGLSIWPEPVVAATAPEEAPDAGRTAPAITFDSPPTPASTAGQAPAVAATIQAPASPPPAR